MNCIPGKALKLAVLSMSLVGTGCGYHVAGHSSALPGSIRTIAIPAIENKTTTYRIEQRLTAATIHEFLAKTQYRVVSDTNGGDAVLHGKVLTVEAIPLLLQNTTTATPTGPITTARATTMLITMRCEVTLQERDSGKVLYHTNNFVFRNEYEISTDVKSFFEEQDPALDRMAVDFAKRLVAALLENY